MANPQDYSSLKMPKLKSPSINPKALIVLVLAIAIIGGTAVTRFVKAEKNRELLSWQNRLALIADSRQADVERWLDRYYKELSDVAGNPSLQLYLTELLSDPGAATAEDPAQAVFLRNLLSMTADRLGFIAPPSKELTSINADVRPPSGVGIAILDKDGKSLVSTSAFMSSNPDLPAKIEALPKDKASLIDIFQTQDGKSRIGWVVPIYPIQTDPSSAQPIGRLVAVKNVDGDLFKLLHHPGATDKTLEALLLRREGDNAFYLSPQEDKGAASQLALNTPDLDAAFALQSPGAFAQKRDGRSRLSLMTSRPIVRTPWVLMLHVDRDQALRDSEVRLSQIQYSLFFALCAMIGGIVAVWYYGTSKRTMLLSQQTKRMAKQVAAQEKLLRVVADNQLEPIVIADKDGIVRFANAKAAKVFHVETLDVSGKTLEALMGAAYAKSYEEANKLALARNAPFVRTWAQENDAGVKVVIRSEHIPLFHVPVDELEVPTAGVLMIDQDITEIVNEREHRERILRQMVDMLVTMVDRRDPYAASHSACVAFVAKAIASNMGLDRQRIEAAETAGNLMNIGKLLIPSEVLTKPTALTEDEMRRIHQSLQHSIKLLERVEFDGPVVDTLRQAQERFDGSGPMGLKGEGILITARIIAVANAFVGMISLRAYRDALSMDEALKTLLAGIDTQYDRRVVVALADYVENGPGRDVISKLLPAEKPQAQ
ncbi:MAG: hypothetical protein PHE27_02745 [Alphaproteobacteria bacterium]|nr:hypothetical protein [Alphaproteobacteria bacterium]